MWREIKQKNFFKRTDDTAIKDTTLSEGLTTSSSHPGTMLTFFCPLYLFPMNVSEKIHYFFPVFIEIELIVL